MKTYLETEEVELLEKAATNLHDRLLVRLLFRLGCRVSEALALTVEDIDFDQDTVTIQHLKVRLKLSCPKCGARLGKSHTFCPGCGIKVEKALIHEQERRRVRTLPVDDDALEMLRDYIRRGGPVPREGKMLIFGINRHRAWQIVSVCAERAGLPKLINPETGRVHKGTQGRGDDWDGCRSLRLSLYRYSDSAYGPRLESDLPLHRYQDLPPMG